jgi:hypothetical protein
MGSLLDVFELDGLRSMSNLPHDERIKLNTERAKSIETLCNKIKVNLICIRTFRLALKYSN